MTILKQLGGTAANIALAIALAWVLAAALHGEEAPDKAQMVEQTITDIPPEELAALQETLRASMNQLTDMDKRVRIATKPLRLCKFKEWERHFRGRIAEPRDSHCDWLRPGEYFQQVESLFDSPTLAAVHALPVDGERYVLRNEMNRATGEVTQRLDGAKNACYERIGELTAALESRDATIVRLGEIDGRTKEAADRDRERQRTASANYSTCAARVKRQLDTIKALKAEIAALKEATASP